MKATEARSDSKIFIVIPAYNEAPVIGTVLDEIMKAGYKYIVVVDDGSNDGTYGIIRKKGIIPLRHSLNRGKGAAIKTGMEAAKILGADIVVTIDADGQHNPKDIAPMVEMVKDGYDVVLGIRDFRKRHIPRIKALGNYIGNAVTWMFYGLWVSDSQSGLRAYNRRAIDLVRINNDRYEFESEIVRELARNRLKWTEKIIDVRYSAYDQKKKNKQSLTSAIKTVIRLALSE